VVLARGLRDELGLLNPSLPMDQNLSRLVLLGEEAGMFELTRCSLLEADVEAVVNTINTEGIAEHEGHHRGAIDGSYDL
jgi:hypothetical protein